MDEYVNKTELEKYLQKLSRRYFDLYYATKSEDCRVRARGYDLAADEVYGFSATDKWISIKDKLPVTRKTILIYDEYEGVSAGYYDSDYAKFRSIEDVYRSCNVTHWMPLPDPPKEA